ncbi:hypothetical protein [Pseudomonas sp. AFG_SD02_1510_Pfu_092]|uniref:hypothetical protein n=1 Tax=Pseudomonas sp. AFG_SD02_1510_Pfu_092 TaxID=2259497 RepID=UPI00137AB644|nr:hypothetical protein [Pseudomonas sp. AFG_SD02_1510_Pfu_092]
MPVTSLRKACVRPPEVAKIKIKIKINGKSNSKSNSNSNSCVAAEPECVPEQ